MLFFTNTSPNSVLAPPPPALVLLKRQKEEKSFFTGEGRKERKEVILTAKSDDIRAYDEKNLVLSGVHTPPTSLLQRRLYTSSKEGKHRKRNKPQTFSFSLFRGPLKTQKASFRRARESSEAVETVQKKKRRKEWK